MRIKKQVYQGRPAVALYISERSKKIQEKLLRMNQREEEQAS